MASHLDEQARAAIKRLNADWKEIQQSPMVGVAASPLEKDIFEWHCNFDFEGTVYHVLLYFPKNYPAKSPSAEFISGIEFSGATKRGPKGGTQVCLSIFSDFAFVHDEWANEKGTGWSPSYTVQTVLLNLLSFLVETSSGRSYYGYGASSKNKATETAAKAFVCKDCGHMHDKPYPPLPTKDGTNEVKKFNEITCYVTRLNITDVKKEVFGFGISKGDNPKNITYTSPCEFITNDGYEMLRASGKVESVMREEIQYFLPLFINEAHAKNIPGRFEQALSQITGGASYSSMILNLLPKLMNSAVLSFMNGTTHASERALHGYFAFHRLFIWAAKTYNLLPEINEKISQFINNPTSRLKRNTPNLGDWLTYLSVASSLGWDDVASAFLHENFLRNVMWYLKEDPSLGDMSINRSRIDDTFRLTKISRDLLAFQVLFLDVARPKGLALDQVAARYDENNGLPTKEMEEQMKAALAKIKKGVKNYDDFFELLKVPVPSSADLLSMLKESVETASRLDGYFTRGFGGVRGGGRGGGRGGNTAWDRFSECLKDEKQREKNKPSEKETKVESTKSDKTDNREQETSDKRDKDDRKTKDKYNSDDMDYKRDNNDKARDDKDDKGRRDNDERKDRDRRDRDRDDRKDRDRDDRRDRKDRDRDYDDRRDRDNRDRRDRDDRKDRYTDDNRRRDKHRRYDSSDDEEQRGYSKRHKDDKRDDKKDRK